MREKYLRNNIVLTKPILKNIILLTTVIITVLLNNHYYHSQLFKTATENNGCATNLEPEIGEII